MTLYLYDTNKNEVLNKHEVFDAKFEYDNLEEGVLWVRRRHPLDNLKAIQLEQFAQAVSKYEGRTYMAGRNCICQVPAVGEPISYAINGDYRIDGHVLAVSASSKRITSTNNKKYNWSQIKGGWYNYGTFVLVPGHINLTNPEV